MELLSEGKWASVSSSGSSLVGGSLGDTNKAVYPLVSKSSHPIRRSPNKEEKGFWTPAKCYHVFHVFDKEGGLIGFYPVRSAPTIQRVIEGLKDKNISLLYRGLYHIPAEVWWRIKEVRKGTKGLDVLELSKRYKQAVPDLQELIHRPYYFFIDIDAKDEETQKRLELFLHLLRKRGIEPFLYETQKGYHLYIQAFHSVQKRKKVLATKDEDGKTEFIKVEETFYVPAFSDDPRLEYILSALKRLLAYAGVKADKASFKHAVWMECFPNACKGGFASKLLREGKPHTVGYLFKRLKNEIAFVELEKRRRIAVRRIRKQSKPEETTVYFPAYEHSCIFDYLNDDEIRVQSLRYLRLTNGDTAGLQAKLESILPIKTRSDRKVLEEFLSWVESAYLSWVRRKQEQKQETKTKTKKERKHLHFYELLPYVKEALESDNIRGYQQIAHYITAQIGRKVCGSSVYRLIKLAGGPERILNEYEKVEQELKARAKGGYKKPKLPLDEYLDKLYQEVEEYVKSIRGRFRSERSEEGSTFEIDFDINLLWAFGALERKSLSTAPASPKKDKKKKNLLTPPRACSSSEFKVFPLYFLDLGSREKTEALKAVLKEFEDPEGYEVVALVRMHKNLFFKKLGVKVSNFKALWERLKQSGLRVMGLAAELRELFYRVYQSQQERPIGVLFGGRTDGQAGAQIVRKEKEQKEVAREGGTPQLLDLLINRQDLRFQQLKALADEQGKKILGRLLEASTPILLSPAALSVPEEFWFKLWGELKRVLLRSFSEELVQAWEPWALRLWKKHKEQANERSGMWHDVVEDGVADGVQSDEQAGGRVPLQHGGPLEYETYFLGRAKKLLKSLIASGCRKPTALLYLERELKVPIAKEWLRRWFERLWDDVERALKLKQMRKGKRKKKPSPPAQPPKDDGLFKDVEDHFLRWRCV